MLLYIEGQSAYLETFLQPLSRFQDMRFDPQYIRASVAKFDKLEFRKNIVDFINSKLEEDNKLILA